MSRSFYSLDVDNIQTNSIVSSSGLNATQLQGENISATTPLDTQVLAYNSSTTQWEPTNPAGGSNATQLQGVDISATAPLDTQVLAYNSSTTQWEPTTGGSNATQLQSVDISVAAPLNTQALVYNSSTSQWEPTNLSGGSGTRTAGTYTIWVDNVTGNDITGNGTSGSPYQTIAKAVQVFGTVNYDTFHLMLVKTVTDYEYYVVRDPLIVGNRTYNYFADFTTLNERCSTLIIEGYTAPKTLIVDTTDPFSPDTATTPTLGPNWDTLTLTGVLPPTVPTFIMDNNSGDSRVVYPTGSTVSALNVISGDDYSFISSSQQYWYPDDLVSLNAINEVLYTAMIPTLEFRQISISNSPGIISNNVAFRRCYVSTTAYQTSIKLSFYGCTLDLNGSKLTSVLISSCMNNGSIDIYQAANVQFFGFYSSSSFGISDSTGIVLSNVYVSNSSNLSSNTGTVIDSCAFHGTPSTYGLHIQGCSGLNIYSSGFRASGGTSVQDALGITNSQVTMNSNYISIATTTGLTPNAAIEISDSTVRIISLRNGTGIGRRLFSINDGSIVTWVSSVGNFITTVSTLVDMTNCSKLIYKAGTSLGSSSHVFNLTKNSSLISTVGALANAGSGSNVLKLGTNAVKGWIPSNNAVYDNLSSGNLAFTHATDEYCVVLG